VSGLLICQFNCWKFGSASDVNTPLDLTPLTALSIDEVWPLGVVGNGAEEPQVVQFDIQL